MSNLLVLVPHLTEIMSKFYKDMLEHEQLSVFFRDQNQIDNLIESQKNNFIDSLNDSSSQLENRYFRLGELHFDLRVPSADFLKSTTIWRRNFIDHVIKILKKPELVEDIENYFMIVNSFMSQGYLSKQLEIDKKDLENLIYQYENNELIKSDAALSHLQWLYQILVAIQAKDVFLAPELDVDKCKIHTFLTEPPAEMQSLFSKEHFNDLHHRLHIDARSLFYFVEKSDYLEVLSLYSNLLSVYKITLITLGNINLQQTAINLKQNLHETKDELLISRNEALRANKAKSEFLSRMSHELRTPLNAILGFSELLEMELTDSHLNENLKEISNAGYHLLKLIDDILDISKIEAGKTELLFDTCNLNTLIAECISIIKPLADKRSIHINNNINNLDYCVFVDQMRFKQVLLNVLSNAVKYNNRDGKIIIECTENDKNMLCLSISDTGDGLTINQLKNLFKPFERVGAQQTIIEGTGLGLVISKDLIELMNGTISVESEINKGTTFLIKIPSC